jgi:hypothetical protein
MNDKKNLMKKILDKFTEEELQDLLNNSNMTIETEKDTQEERKSSHTHSINGGNKRRGSGYRKKNKNTNKTKKRNRNNNKGKACRVLPMDLDQERSNKFEEIINNTNLDQNEQRELSQASETDEKARKNQRSFKKMSRQSSLLEVECCVCGDEYEVSSAIVSDVNRWKCNNCSCQPGY